MHGNQGPSGKGVYAQHRHQVFMADSKAEARTLRSASFALDWELQKEQILYKVNSVALTLFKGKHIYYGLPCIDNEIISFHILIIFAFGSVEFILSYFQLLLEHRRYNWVLVQNYFYSILNFISQKTRSSKNENR